MGSAVVGGGRDAGELVSSPKIDGRLVTAKRPTTPADQSEGVMAAVEAVLSQAGREPEAVGAFAHGMTVATNALLEGRVARTALVATEGFKDIVALGRQHRPQLYRLCADWAPPLVPEDLRFEAPERMTPEDLDLRLRTLRAAVGSRR